LNRFPLSEVRRNFCDTVSRDLQLHPNRTGISSCSSFYAQLDAARANEPLSYAEAHRSVLGLRKHRNKAVSRSNTQPSIASALKQYGIAAGVRSLLHGA
jgi:hypothetical protein